MKKLDNKGFTLVELLAVLVILISVMTIAVPAISGSLEESKSKQFEKNKKLLANASDFYVTNNKDVIFITLNGNTSCFIDLNFLKNENYVDSSVLVDIDGNDLSDIAAIVFDSVRYTFTYTLKKDIDNDIKECTTGVSANAESFSG